MEWSSNLVLPLTGSRSTQTRLRRAPIQTDTMTSKIDTEALNA
jgi:hypothetical protein